MRRSLRLALVVLGALPVAAADAEDAPAIHLVVRVDGEGAQVRSSRWAAAAPAALPSTVLENPRWRVAEWPDADGRWQGRPVFVDQGAIALTVPAAYAGEQIDIVLEGLPPQRLLVPLPEDGARGEPPEVITVRDSGPPSERQDLVFLAEGYTALERDLFLDDVDRALDYLDTLEPYSRYLPLVSVHAVVLSSAESGADHPEAVPSTEADTALDCSYGGFDVDRLIICDATKVLDAAAEAPGDDVRVVLVNDPTYGGSGGTDYATVFTGLEMPQGVAHEMAHSDALLADEYDYGYSSGGEHWPMTNCHWDAVDPPWLHWIDAGSQGVSAFAPCGFSDYYRPTFDSCLMNLLVDNFCVVCREQVVRAIYAHVSTLVTGVSPAELPPLQHGESVEVSVDTLEPEGQALYFTWRLAETDEVLAEGAGARSLTLDWADVEPGSWTLTVEVEDRVGWVLVDVPAAMNEWLSWDLEVGEGPVGDDDDATSVGSVVGQGCRGCAQGGAATSSASVALAFLPLLAARRRLRRGRRASRSAADRP